MNLSELGNDNNVSMLLKSPYGFGKTIAACSAAVDGPVYLAYFDKKTPIEVVSFFKKIGRPELIERITWDLYGSHNANVFLNKLMDLQKDCRYIAVIVDSVTQLTAAAVNWSMGFRNPKGPKKDALNPTSMQLIPDFDEYKVETSLVTQALDLCKALPCHVIWTCHPLPSLKMEGGGSSMKVTKVNNIVTYGSKVGAIVPGCFTEIYHFGQTMDYNVTPSRMKRFVATSGIGDDFAKTAYNLPAELDITDKLFWDVWKAAVNSAK